MRAKALPVSRWSRVAPLFLTVVGFGGIGGLWTWQALSMSDVRARAFALAAGGLYGAWLLWESRVSAREVSRSAANADHGTMEVAALAKMAFLLATLLSPSAPTTRRAVLGLALMLLGIGLRAAAVRALGAAYSHRIRTPDGPIVARGPYRVIRHPAYLGTFVAHAGLVLVFPSVGAAAALLLLWLPAVVLRAAVEDRFLLGHGEYATYARNVRYRLVPGVY